MQVYVLEKRKANHRKTNLVFPWTLILTYTFSFADNKRTLYRKQRHSNILSTTINPDDEDDDELQIDDDDRVYKNPRNFPNTNCPRDEDKAEFMVSLP